VPTPQVRARVRARVRVRVRVRVSYPNPNPNQSAERTPGLDAFTFDYAVEWGDIGRYREI
jgi:hypothetical protein